jgi:glycogen(starch) synthase
MGSVTWSGLMQANVNRVFMIGWEYPPHNSGGLGVACEGLTKALSDDQQLQIDFTLPYSPPEKIQHMNVHGCVDESWLDDENYPTQPPFSVYHQVPVAFEAVDLKMLDRYKLTALPQSILETKVEQYAGKVLETGASTDQDFDIIHAHDWMSFPAGIKLKQKTGKPLVTHIHSTEHDRTALGTGSPYITHTEYEGVRMSDRVIAVSGYTKHLLVEKYGADPAKIDVVHNGIDPLITPPKRGKHYFASKRPVVAFMGRLTLHKGVEYFLAVAKYVTRQIPDALFVVAGSGDMYHQLLIRTAQERLTASVLFSGFVRDRQKEILLNRADVFMMPSVSEPFGLVALEAAQRQIPVIISKNAGVSEVLKNSIALDFWDVEAMGKTVIKILSDRGYASNIVEGQLRDLNNLTWDRAAAKVSQVYRKAFLG